MLRLDKFLSDTGHGTRNEIRSFIRRGAVMVDGHIETNPGYRLDENRQAVCVEGVPVCYRPFLYYMMYKPDGLLSSTKDPRQKTVLDLMPEQLRTRGLFPVGRLDKDAQGLLLLTNDGALAHRLAAPKHHVEKRYGAVVDRTPDAAQRALFEQGLIVLDGKPVKPAKLSVVSDKEPLVVEVCLVEGRYHQVKRMLSACGCQVLQLKRLAIGPLVLDEALLPGGFRPLSDDEVQALQKLL